MGTIENIPKFWWLKPYIIDNGWNVGHSLFSFGHIIWLIVIAIMSIIVSKCYKNANEKKRQHIRKICAILIFLLEYVKIVIVSLLYPNYMDQYVPIHLCSIAGICIIFDALYPNTKVVNSWWIYVFLICGLLSIVSPSSTYPWLNFFCIHEFLFHGLLFVYAVLKIVSSESKVSYIGLLYSILLLTVMFVPIYYINITFDKGYMLITKPSDFPLAQFIWNHTVPTFGIFGYIGVLMFLVLIVFHIIYLIGFIVKKIKSIKKV